MRTNENASVGALAKYETKLNSKYNRMPPYGKAILELRLAGKIPSTRVIVSFSWDIGKAYSRIVLADQTPPDQLAFWYLAGLHVEIVYRSKDAHRVNAVVDEILKINPASLMVFGIDLIETSFAVTVIKPYESSLLSEAA